MHGQQIATLTQGAGERASELYVEAPVTDRFAVLGVLREDGAVAVEAAAKAVVWRDGGAVAAAQAGLFWSDAPAVGCEAVGAEVRGLAGFGEGPWFFNLEAAYRDAGDCQATRWDATLGWRPAENWLTLAQLFLHRDDYGQLSRTLQLSLVRFSDDGSGVQVGLRLPEDPAGLQLVIGLWGDFRQP